MLFPFGLPLRKIWLGGSGIIGRLNIVSFGRIDHGFVEQLALGPAWDDEEPAVERKFPRVGALVIDVPENGVLEPVHHLAVFHLVLRFVFGFVHHLVTHFGHIGHELVADVLPGLQRDGDNIRRRCASLPAHQPGEVRQFLG